jgi:glyoxylate/hydroxypyruvate reductase A
MKIVVYSPDNQTPLWIQGLQSALPNAEVWAWTPERASRLADYAVVWAPPAELFATQTALKAVFSMGAGVDALLRIPHLPGVPIVRLSDAGMAVQMAEYVCHAIFRFTRQFDQYERQAARKIWNKLRAPDRQQFPVGVMGLGAIGTRVAQSIALFDYPVHGWSRTPRTIEGITTYAGEDELAPFLRASRILVCVLPLTPETEGILNAANMSTLLPEGYLINVARGKLLVEQDLLALLKGGTLSGATLDVFDREPLGPDHPFWLHPQITITPHISAMTLRDESIAQIATRIHALERGDSIDGVVDRARGY